MSSVEDKVAAIEAKLSRQIALVETDRPLEPMKQPKTTLERIEEGLRELEGNIEDVLEEIEGDVIPPTRTIRNVHTANPKPITEKVEVEPKFAFRPKVLEKRPNEPRLLVRYFESKRRNGSNRRKYIA